MAGLEDPIVDVCQLCNVSDDNVYEVLVSEYPKYILSYFNVVGEAN